MNGTREIFSSYKNWALVQFPAPTTIYTSISRGSDILFWPPKGLYAHTFMQAKHQNTYIILNIGMKHTIKPVNGRFSRWRVIKWHCCFPFWLSRVFVCVKIYHWFSSLFVSLRKKNWPNWCCISGISKWSCIIQVKIFFEDLLFLIICIYVCMWCAQGFKSLQKPEPSDSL